MDARYPAALDLEAGAVDALHAALHGCAAQTNGTHTPEYWREALRGIRPVQLSDLCRLATEPTKEPCAAARAVVLVLAAAVGLELAPTQGRPTKGAWIEAAEALEALTALNSALALASLDGVDESEKAILRDRYLPKVEQEVADLRSALR